MKGPQRLQVREPPPTRDMHGVGLPDRHAFDQRRIPQSKKMMRPRILRGIGHELELVSLREGNVPRHRHSEPAILERCTAIVPGEEHLDLEVVATREALVEWGIILDRMGYDERQPPRPSSVQWVTAFK